MRPLISAALALLLMLPAAPALADDELGDEAQNWAIHGQETIVLQANPAFRSPYQGPNSLDPRPHAKETFDITLYVGLRPWSGAEIWVDPEIDQGFGLSDTLGVAGFPSGEAYKVGKWAPYLKLPRWFLRQTIELGGKREPVSSDLTQLAGHVSHDRLVLTIGKFSVVDIFDTSEQAHDPRSDFMNWTVIDTGTFDYAANAWGYTYGAAVELYAANWALRVGAFDLSKVPNSEQLDPGFGQYELDGEIEHRHSILGQPGRIKVTFYLNHGRMGRFEDAIRLSALSGGPPDIAAVRRMQNRTGIGVNFDQQLSTAASMFIKAGLTNGGLEPYEFTDVDRTITAGATLKGAGWGRSDDCVGLAAVVNAISRIHRQFLDLGGLGILIGDGRLPHPGTEQILEAYYDLALVRSLHFSLDAQVINHPGYNRDRGPVAVGAVRLHAQF